MLRKHEREAALSALMEEFAHEIEAAMTRLYIQLGRIAKNQGEVDRVHRSFTKSMHTLAEKMSEDCG